MPPRPRPGAAAGMNNPTPEARVASGRTINTYKEPWLPGHRSVLVSRANPSPFPWMLKNSDEEMDTGWCHDPTIPSSLRAASPL